MTALFYIQLHLLGLQSPYDNTKILYESIGPTWKELWRLRVDMRYVCICVGFHSAFARGYRYPNRSGVCVHSNLDGQDLVLYSNLHTPGVGGTAFRAA